jgi:hypothetical protein
MRIAVAVVLGLLLAVAVVAVLAVVRSVRRWLDRAAADREREEYESRDWLDPPARRRPTEPAGGDDQAGS